MTFELLAIPRGECGRVDSVHGQGDSVGDDEPDVRRTVSTLDRLLDELGEHLLAPAHGRVRCVVARGLAVGRGQAGAKRNAPD